jgi:hypothetical protein
VFRKKKVQLIVVSILFSSMSASSQEMPSDPAPVIHSETVEAENVLDEEQIAPLQGRIYPTSPTFAQHALFNSAGHIQIEMGYVSRIYEAPIATHQSLSLNSVFSLAEMFEGSFGWDIYNVQGEIQGIGDITLGFKGGFFGGLDRNIALAGIVEIQFPSGEDDFRTPAGTGTRLLGGMVATLHQERFYLDLELAVDAHVFTESPTIGLPIAVAVNWIPVGDLKVIGEAVVSLDLNDLNDTELSVLLGAGYDIAPRFGVDVSARVGLSESLPDAVFTAGITCLFGPVSSGEHQTSQRR